MKQCRAAGCDRPTSSIYSSYCQHHRSRLRRNGDPAQRGVTKAELKPYVRMVHERMAKNANNKTWDIMDQRWRALVQDAKARIAAYQAGTASVRQNIKAAEEIVRLAEGVPSRDVVVTVAAMFLMQALSPGTFRNDQAFDVQLVRRVRGLIAADAPTYRDPRTGKMRRTHQELTPKASIVMADWLRMTLGVLGMRLARLEEEERRAEADANVALSDALMDLK
jgi:hypothetical protein